MTLSSRLGRNLVAKSAVLALALTLAVPLASVSADARAGGGSSFGSRGSRTFSMPSPTNTAPRAAPFQRSDTPNMGQSAGGLAGAAAQPRRFGFGTGLAAGLLGAGLFGMLSGNGFFGGLGGLTSMLGLLLQIGLIWFLASAAIRFFRNRQNPATANGAAGQAPNTFRTGMAGFGGLGGGSGGAQPNRKVLIATEDYTTFERLLHDVQAAFSREDMNALSRLTTPEVLNGFGSDLQENRSRGLRNEISDVVLHQGDLSESWGEGATDYATVAMRFGARDVMVDRSTGKLMSGDPTRPVDATEFWTFRRDQGGTWILSGIQQAN